MANPPVCRIMDYGKFRYEEAQKAKESRRKSANVSIKEVKFKPKIGRGDFDTKVRKIDQFLNEGHKVKVTMQFRGREMAHPELGSKILDDVLDIVGEHVKVETQARLEGRNMSMVLAPDRKPIPKGQDETADGEPPAITEAVQPESQAGEHATSLIRIHDEHPPTRSTRHAEDEDLENRRQAVQDHGQWTATPRPADEPAQVLREDQPAEAAREGRCRRELGRPAQDQASPG